MCGCSKVIETTKLESFWASKFVCGSCWFWRNTFRRNTHYTFVNFQAVGISDRNCPLWLVSFLYGRIFAMFCYVSLCTLASIIYCKARGFGFKQCDDREPMLLHHCIINGFNLVSGSQINTLFKLKWATHKKKKQHTFHQENGWTRWYVFKWWNKA